MITVTLCQALALEASWRGRLAPLCSLSPDVWRWREVGKGKSWDESQFWPEPDGEASERQDRKEAESFSVDVSLASSAHSLLSCRVFFSSTLVSDLYSYLFIINDYTNACQVFLLKKNPEYNNIGKRGERGIRWRLWLKSGIRWNRNLWAIYNYDVIEECSVST